MISNEESKNTNNQGADRPWRDEKGNLKPDSELKTIATLWSPSTWEAYLADVELGENTGSDSKEEILFGHPERDDIFSSDNSLKDYISDTDTFPKLIGALNRASASLSKRQRQIIELRFTEGLNKTEIAARLGATRQTISILLDRALTKIRTAMLEELAPKVPEQSEETCLRKKEQIAINAAP